MDSNAPAKTILVIEDEVSLRMAMVSKIAEERFQTIEAENGQQGLKIALEKHPDLIVLDLMLPVMDGMAFLTELQKDPWGKDAKVIVLSNLSPHDLEEKGAILKEYPFFEKTKLVLENFLESIKLSLN